MPRVALLPLFASLASAAVVGDYDPMPTSPACDKFCGAWTCASRYGSFYCHEPPPSPPPSHSPHTPLSTSANAASTA